MGSLLLTRLGDKVTTEQPVIDINVYSNLSKLEGIFAYCCAFSSNCRRSATERTFGPLTSKEIKLASLYLIKISQRESFSSEIIAGSRSRPSLVTSFLRPVRFHTINTTHFIIAADPDLTKIPEARPSHFQRIQQLQQYFWNRWSREYISEMQQRNKWASQHGTLKFNDLVLVMEDNQPSARWALRRIEVLHPGGEGVARVATIRTPTGSVRRSFAKICPLPAGDLCRTKVANRVSFNAPKSLRCDLNGSPSTPQKPTPCRNMNSEDFDLNSLTGWTKKNAVGMQGQRAHTSVTKRTPPVQLLIPPPRQAQRPQTQALGPQERTELPLTCQDTKKTGTGRKRRTRPYPTTNSHTPKARQLQ
ncbi:hypothetical protein NQ318_017252 [Aromia moschata]|uniref:DUF5641 domain-containing protein n=1 Tax=Aromia moschata TaxID=1265417 RepID=A0AAV8YKV3_9CUCU|nr:hypothetical protein NQ318_017252 [Aromia moschata]